jgi:uncharacterized membrane protein
MSLSWELDKDLIIINTISIALVAVIALFPGSVVRIVLGIPFVLFFPGYTLTAALYPGNEVLEWVDRIALSIGLSLSVVPLIALGLNFTPWGIRMVPVLTSLFLFTLLLSYATRLRRLGLPPGERYIPDLSVDIPRWSEIERGDKIMSIGLIIFAVVGTVVTIQLAQSQGPRYRFTEFYVTGPKGVFGDYPKNLTLGESGTVILGIVNREHQSMTYWIEVEMDNKTMDTLDGIQVQHEGTWNQTYTFPPQDNGDHKIGFILYRMDQAEPYRELQLYINVKEPK